MLWRGLLGPECSAYITIPQVRVRVKVGAIPMNAGELKKIIFLMGSRYISFPFLYEGHLFSEKKIREKRIGKKLKKYI